MKKVVSIVLSLCIFISLCSVLCFSSNALDTSAQYFYGNHAKNPMETEKSQGFTPVMTPVATDPEGSLDPDNLLVPPKQTELENNATRWGLQGQAWNGAAQWKNYTGIRSDGRINVDKCAAGVRFDVEVSGTYNVQADFFNNSPANGHYHYIFLKSGEIKRTLYSFDTNTITETADHNITKGTMVQTYDLYLRKGDVLYFVVDSKGQTVGSVYKNLEVAINMTREDPVPDTFEPTVLSEYSFGYTAKNIFSEKGMQNFFPVFSGTNNMPDDFPIFDMIGSDKDPVSESDSWGSYTKWLNSTYEWAYVRSSGHIQPQKNTTAGVVWVAPKDGKYDIKNIEIAFNIKSGATVSTMYYSVYYGNIATKEATRLFSYNNNSAESNEFLHRINLKKGDRLYFLMDMADNSLNNAAPRIRLTIKHVADTPDAPVATNQTATAITLKATEGCEYGYAEGDSTSITYSDSNVIENLEVGKTYKIYQRVKATEAALASDDSAVLEYTMSELGDIDRNNEIGATDLTILRKYLLDTPTEGTYFEGLMNANSVDGIDIRDLVAIKKMSSQVS